MKTMRELSELIVLIKGGGEVASGIAIRLHRSHFNICLTEIAAPLAVSRGATFSEAVFDGIKTFEGVTAELVSVSPEDIRGVWKRGNIPIAIDPHTSLKEQLEPDVLVDAIMAKRNTGTHITDAPLVIGLGPGFAAGRDVQIVVETNQGNNLGRVILDGEAEPDTGKPVTIGGLTEKRVLWASKSGTFTTDREIGDSVIAHEIIAWIGDQPLEAPITGMLRGLLRSGVEITKGGKLIEVHPPARDKDACYTCRDRIRAIAGGVLEAIMQTFNQSA